MVDFSDLTPRSYLYCTKAASYNFGVLLVNIQTHDGCRCRWPSFCRLAALVDTFRRGDCTCQCVNTALLQPRTPRHSEARRTLHLQFLCSVTRRLSPLCHHDDMGVRMLHHVRLHGGTYLRRRGYDAPHMRADAQSKLTFHFRHQGNRSAVQPTNNGTAGVGIKVKTMCMWILLGDIQWWRKYLESMSILLRSPDWVSSVIALKALDEINAFYSPYWQTVIIMSDILSVIWSVLTSEKSSLRTA